MLPIHRPRRHCLALLLLALGLLAGCRSGRVAFQFRPVLLERAVAAGSTPAVAGAHIGKGSALDSGRTGPSAGQLPGPPARKKLLLLVARRHTGSPAAASPPPTTARQQPKCQRREVVAAPRAVAQRRPQPVSRRAAAQPHYKGPSDKIVVIFLICLVGGALAFLTALILQSLPVALVSVGLLALAFIIFKKATHQW